MHNFDPVFFSISFIVVIIIIRFLVFSFLLQPTHKTQEILLIIHSHPTPQYYCANVFISLFLFWSRRKAKSGERKFFHCKNSSIFYFFSWKFLLFLLYEKDVLFLTCKLSCNWTHFTSLFHAILKFSILKVWRFHFPEPSNFWECRKKIDKFAQDTGGYEE